MADNHPVCADLMQMRPIGCLRSVFQFKNGTPRQPSLCSAARGSLTVDKSIFNNPEHALEGLEQFSHAWIIFVFHKNRPGHTKAKVKPPRLNGKRMGVFSTRSPYRPNAIGLTLAKIERISGSTVHFSGIDIVDGTPVLDIKPFIPQYDVPECRGESFIGDGCSAGSDENCAFNDDTHTLDSIATDLETVSSNPQACEFRHENSGPSTFAEKSTEYTRTAKQEGKCSAEGASNGGHAESSINRTEETTKIYNLAGTLYLDSPKSFPGSCSQTEEPVSVELSSASGERRTVASSQRTSKHNKSERKINTHLGTNHQACNEKGGNFYGASEESLSSAEEKQTSSISSAEEKQTSSISSAEEKRTSSISSAEEKQTSSISSAEEKRTSSISSAEEKQTSSISSAEEKQTSSISSAEEKRTSSISSAEEKQTSSISSAEEKRTSSISSAEEKQTSSISSAEEKQRWRVSQPLTKPGDWSSCNTKVAPWLAAPPVTKVAPWLAAPPVTKVAPWLAAPPVTKVAPWLAAPPVTKVAPWLAAPPVTKVAPWLAAPPVTKLRVCFTPAAEAQLQKFQTENSPNNNDDDDKDKDSQYRLQFLSGGEEVRTSIVSVLAEDPRSVYRREKCSDSLYFFTVDQVHVTCWFDDRENCVEVVRLQPVSFVEKLVGEA